MKHSNFRDLRWRSQSATRTWLIAAALLSVTTWATPGDASEGASSRHRSGTVVAVGPLSELHPTRPDRCARPSPAFDLQVGYVVMYRSPVGFRTRVVALNEAEAARVRVGDMVSVAKGSCSAVLSGTATE